MAESFQRGLGNRPGERRAPARQVWRAVQVGTQRKRDVVPLMPAFGLVATADLAAARLKSYPKV
jgi:hypothetical protein